MWENMADVDVDYGPRPLAMVGRDKRAVAATTTGWGGGGGGGWGWHYNGEADDMGSVDEIEYDLYDDTDRTVAYAVELAMRDREDWLVERALERIRRAQLSGQQNVRLSMRELEAFENRRTGQTIGLNNVSPKGTPTKRAGQATESPPKTANGWSRPRPRRRGSSASYHAGDDHNNHNQTSPPRPRTPTMQTARPQQQSNVSWSPSWARSSQLVPFLSPSRRGSQTGSPTGPVAFPRRGSDERRINRKPLSSSIPMESDADTDKNHDSGDDVQIVDVVQRRVPASPQPRPRGLRSGSGGRR